MSRKETLKPAVALRKAVAYFRQPSHDRAGNPIPVQQDRVRSFAKEHGIEIVGEFTDSNRHRPGRN
ncbi:MAG TPA: recombinase family protein [Planctomycetota bacterium]|nr:recombinase family protein [Planctomycetota bacterium]